MELAISIIQKLCTDEAMIVTQHVANRFLERGITLDDVQAAIHSGEIIEQYPDDYPHPSCLVMGLSSMNKWLHVVCGQKGEII